MPSPALVAEIRNRFRCELRFAAAQAILQARHAMPNSRSPWPSDANVSFVSGRRTACERVPAWVSLVLDGEASPFEGSLLAEHLVSCEKCRVFERDVRGFTEALRSVPLEEPERGVATPRRRRLPVRPVQVVAALGVLVAALGLSTVVGSSLSPEGRGRQPASVGLSDSAQSREFQELKRSALLDEAYPTSPGGLAREP